MWVGIYIGSIIVGSLGGKNCLEYGVIGDSVNIVFWLESFEKEYYRRICWVLIVEEIFKYLDGKFKVEFWGNFCLKGKIKLISIYLVSGKK